MGWSDLLYRRPRNIAKQYTKEAMGSNFLRPCRRRERRLIGARFGRWRGERFGRYRCLTLRCSVLLSVWVDPTAEHRGDRGGSPRGIAKGEAVRARHEAEHETRKVRLTPWA